MTQESADKLTQQAMKRVSLGVSLRNHITNKQIRQRSEFQDRNLAKTQNGT